MYCTCTIQFTGGKETGNSISLTSSSPVSLISSTLNMRSISSPGRGFGYTVNRPENSLVNVELKIISFMVAPVNMIFLPSRNFMMSFCLSRIWNSPVCSTVGAVVKPRSRISLRASFISSLLQHLMHTSLWLAWDCFSMIVAI